MRAATVLDVKAVVVFLEWEKSSFRLLGSEKAAGPSSWRSGW
jgi:hypothetical protein